MELEFWESIPNHSNYEISNLGKVWSNHRNRCKTPIKTAGYLYIRLDECPYRIHRLVAKAFCEKRNGCDIVDHIDGNPINNRADNLRWVTYAENASHYRDSAPKRYNAIRSTVEQIKDGNIVQIFKSAQEVVRQLGISSGNLYSCLNGNLKYKTIQGFSYKYTRGKDPEPRGSSTVTLKILKRNN